MEKSKPSPHGREMLNPHPFPFEILEWLTAEKHILLTDNTYRGRLAILDAVCLRCGSQCSPTFNNLWNNDQGACRGCAQVAARTSKFHYSLLDFRNDLTDPEQPLHLYLYAWDDFGKTGLGRPSNYWDGRGGEQLHHLTLPAVVASAAEEMLLHTLQGDQYRRTPSISIGTGTDTTTEWFTVGNYYLHRQRVEAILQWSSEPSTLEFFTSNLHEPSVEEFFGPHPPTAPPIRRLIAA